VEGRARCTGTTACGIAASATTTEDAAEDVGTLLAAAARRWCKETLERVAFVGA